MPASSPPAPPSKWPVIDFVELTLSLWLVACSPNTVVMAADSSASFPSGHATSSFALAAVFAILLTDPVYRRVPRALRLLLVLMALLLAAAVAATMIAIGAHVFTDAVAGAAVGTGVVLACALTLDLAVRRAQQVETDSVHSDDQHVA